MHSINLYGCVFWNHGDQQIPPHRCHGNRPQLALSCADALRRMDLGKAHVILRFFPRAADSANFFCFPPNLRVRVGPGARRSECAIRALSHRGSSKRPLTDVGGSHHDRHLHVAFTHLDATDGKPGDGTTPLEASLGTIVDTPFVPYWRYWSVAYATLRVF